MGKFNKKFTDYSKDKFISAEEIQELARGYSYQYHDGPIGDDGNETSGFRLKDQKGFWKKFKDQYKKKGSESLSIAGVAGKVNKEKLINAYNNPKYGPPVTDIKEEKDKNKFKSTVELLDDDYFDSIKYKPEYQDTSAIDKKYNLRDIQKSIDETEANAAPSPTLDLNSSKGLLKGIGSEATKIDGLKKDTRQANRGLKRLMDKASKFESKISFNMVPDIIQKEKTRQLQKIGPSGPNYKPIKYKDSAFKDVLPQPGKKGAFGVPSTTKAEGVSTKKNKKK